MKVGFFVCSNGYGHFMRVSKIANQLKKLYQPLRHENEN